jgi:tetratricopeptide (TPR) repeat protein
MRSRTEANLKGSVRLGNYLRRLRTGYGYSLRRVEERAKAEGGEIDNSQLSRYEKGICYPSFDKLRVLASVFNVSVQAFSDVVDLEEYEELKPASTDVPAILEHGKTALRAGDVGRAFACFERALELLLDADDPDPDLVAQARINQAAALSRLGKLSLAEHELRGAMRQVSGLSEESRTRALLALAAVHADQGDLFLAELEAERAHRHALAEQRRDLAARALHNMARVLAERGAYAEAIERFREASVEYAACGEHHEGVRVRTQIGACYVHIGKVREGMRIISGAIQEAHGEGHRRLEAHGWSCLGEAYYRQQNYARARSCFRRSDALASHNGTRHPDVLFHNAYYEWKMARAEGNPTGEKIAFGRLKVLRSSLERRLPEVEAFDAFVERGRSDA